MDYPQRRRVKLWGRAAFVEHDADLLARVADPDYDAVVERALVFVVEAWDMNCHQHITPRYTVDELPPGGLDALGAGGAQRARAPGR